MSACFSLLWRDDFVVYSNFNPCVFFIQHEKGSIAMFDHLIESDNLRPSLEQYGLSGTDIIFIKELIVDAKREAAHQIDWPYKGRGIDKSFLYGVKIIVYNVL